jgi:hypothetical protein
MEQTWLIFTVLLMLVPESLGEHKKLNMDARILSLFEELNHPSELSDYYIIPELTGPRLTYRQK